MIFYGCKKNSTRYLSKEESSATLNLHHATAEQEECAHNVRTVGKDVPVGKFFDKSDKTRHYSVKSTGEGEEEKEGGGEKRRERRLRR